MQQDVEIIDRFGRKRRARKGKCPQDGETIHFPMTLMDAMSRVMSDAMESNRMIRDGMAHPPDIDLDMPSPPTMPPARCRQRSL